MSPNVGPIDLKLMLESSLMVNEKDIDRGKKDKRHHLNVLGWKKMVKDINYIYW